MPNIIFEKKILTNYKGSKNDTSKDMSLTTNQLVNVGRVTQTLTQITYMPDTKTGDLKTFYVSVPVYRVWGILADAINAEKDNLKKPATEYLQILKTLENKSIPIPQMLYEAATKEEPVKKAPAKKDVKKPAVKKNVVKKVTTGKTVKQPVAKKAPLRDSKGRFIKRK